MNIKIKSEELLLFLNKIKHMAKPDKANPAAAFALFETCGDKVLITVRNLINFACVSVPAVVLEDGRCLVEAGKLALILSSLSGDISIETKPEFVWIKQNKTKCKLPVLAEAEFCFEPFGVNNSGGKFVMTSTSLADGILKVKKFASAESPLLSGINIRAADRMVTFSATDGNRCASAVKCTESDFACADFILPSISAANLLPLIPEDGSIEINFNKTSCTFTVDEAEFSTRLIGGVFPRTDRLFPISSAIEFAVDKGELQRALDCIAAVEEADDLSRVSFSVKGVFLTVEAEGYKYNSVLTLTEKNGEDISFRINRIYLRDLLSVLSGNIVRFRMNSSRSPILFCDMENKYLIMPIG